uniref:Transposable element P transposase-like GTP-binding insertion domain-containing protein n=1 Tax=Amphimedon queenslandica TaxID=400682 RepID=A0A1X7VXJ4_AMPQE
MRVDLAAQVLSQSVGKAIYLTGGTQVVETSRFVLIFDKWFDLLNVRSFKGVQSRKPFLYPYRNGQDRRLEWLEKTFLPYLNEWRTSVEGRTDLTSAERNRMQLSSETLIGLKQTGLPFVELLCVVSRPPKEFFGRQRQQGATNNNSTVQQFIDNTQSLMVVNFFCLGAVRQNCRVVEEAKSPAAENPMTVMK